MCIGPTFSRIIVHQRYVLGGMRSRTVYFNRSIVMNWVIAIVDEAVVR